MASPILVRTELLERSKENKEAYDKQRLDNFYDRGYNINKIAGREVLPEPCDPRDPEFGYKCGSKLPRLPQDRLDPFDPRQGGRTRRTVPLRTTVSLIESMTFAFACLPYFTNE